MSINLIIIQVGIIVFSLGNQPDGVYRLPAWFWDLPDVAGVELAVGYSPPYADSPSAFDEAFQDAAWRLFADRRAMVIGQRGSATVPEGKMDIGNTLRLEVDTTGFAVFTVGLVVLDSISTPDLMAILVGNVEVEIDRTFVESPDNEPTLKTAQSTSHAAAPLYYHQSSSWKEAHEKARIELGVGGTSIVKGIGLSLDQNLFQAVVFETRVRLREVRTTHCRLDRKAGVVKVWVTGSVEQVD